MVMRWMRAVRKPLGGGMLALVATGAAQLQLAGAQEPQPPVRLPETVVPGEVTPGEAPPETPPRRPSSDDGGGPTGPAATRGTAYDSPFSTPPSANVGYAPKDSTTGTKIAIPQLEFPGTVGIVPSDLIKDQQILNLADAVRNIPGVYVPTAQGGRSDDVNIRGFSIGFFDSYRKDGFLDISRVQREMANVDRIEVLKGPASVLYGASANPGGILNLITKKPLAQNFNAADFQFGYFDLYRFTSDSTGPVTDSGNMLFRVNTAMEHTESFRDYFYIDRYFIAPAATWILGPDTSFTLLTEYLHDNRIMDRGTVVFRNNIRALPDSRFLGDPNDRSRFNDGSVTAIVDHRFSALTHLRFGWCSNFSQEFRDNFDSRTLVGNTPILTRSNVQQYSRDSDHYFIADLTTEIDTGTVRHHMLFGTELGTAITLNGTGFNAPNTPSINIFAPVYYVPRPPFSTRRPVSGNQNDQYGVYVQDLIDVTRRLHVLVGVRHDDYKQHNFVGAPAAGQKSVRERYDHVWTPRYGIVFEPILDRLSFYASRSQSFSPVNTTLLQRAPLEPETGTAFECGFKANVLSSLFVTGTYFDLTRGNITLADPTNVLFATQIGLTRSEGFEFGVGGNITERWSVVGGYSYQDTRIVADTVKTNVGNRFPNAPYYTASLWSRYNLIQTPGQNIGFAVGMSGLGDRIIVTNNPVTTPSFIRWDAGLFYRKGQLDTSLYVENVGDVQYFQGTQSLTTVQPGAPFNLRGTIRWTW